MAQRTDHRQERHAGCDLAHDRLDLLRDLLLRLLRRRRGLLRDLLVRLNVERPALEGLAGIHAGHDDDDLLEGVHHQPVCEERARRPVSGWPARAEDAR